jgi:hypothetical protein
MILPRLGSPQCSAVYFLEGPIMKCTMNMAGIYTICYTLCCTLRQQGSQRCKHCTAVLRIWKIRALDCFLAWPKEVFGSGNDWFRFSPHFTRELWAGRLLMWSRSVFFALVRRSRVARECGCAPPNFEVSKTPTSRQTRWIVEMNIWVEGKKFGLPSFIAKYRDNICLIPTIKS